MPVSVEVLYSKIHRAVVTDANLNYQGSITIGKSLAQAAHLHPWMKVDVLNVNNGARFTTYVIVSEEEGTICVNGAASRLVHVGDVVIIVAYALMDLEQVRQHQPFIVFVGDNNQIKENDVWSQPTKRVIF